MLFPLVFYVILHFLLEVIIRMTLLPCNPMESLHDSSTGASPCVMSGEASKKRAKKQLGGRTQIASAGDIS